MFKKIFSKIGKGFKKVLKGIGKVLNSKIGKIIGTVFMAYSLGSLFSKMFTKGAATDVLAAGAGEVGDVVGEAAATKGAEVAGTKAAATQVSRGAGVGMTTEEIVASNLENTLHKNIAEGTSTQVLSDSATKSAINGLEAHREDLIISLESEVTPSLTGKVVPHTEVVTPEAITRGFSEPEVSLLSETPVSSTEVIGELEKHTKFTTSQLQDIIQGVPDTETSRNLSYYQEHLGDKFGSALPADASSQQVAQRNLEVAFSQSRPKTIQDAFANKEFRSLYDSKFAETTPFLDSAVSYNASEFTSFGDAWRGGKHAGESLLNVARQPFERSIGEVTGGAWSGYGSTRSAAGTAFTGAQYASAMLADAPEEPVAPNYTARSLAQSELSKAREFTGSVDARELASQVDWSAPSNVYMNQMQNVINATGAPYLYGPTDFNFGHPRYQGAGGSFGGGGATGDY